MAEFLVECYISGADAAAAGRTAERGRLAADELTRAGKPIRYVRSIFVPREETCFFLYEAASADVVRAAAIEAELPFERVTEAFAPEELP